MTNPPLNLSLAGPRIGSVGGYVPHYHVTYVNSRARANSCIFLINISGFEQGKSSNIKVQRAGFNKRSCHPTTMVRTSEGCFFI